MSAHTYDAGTLDFADKVIAASHEAPVLVDFWAEWCAPCRALKPVLEKLAAEYAGRFLLAKVNSDRNPELAAQLGVRGIPNVKLFHQGELVDEFVGALPEAQVRAFLDRWVASAAEPLRQQALAARERGETDAMRKLLLEAIALDPRHEAARLDLVELLIDAAEFAEAGRLLDEIAASARDSGRVQALQAHLHLARAAPTDTDEAALRARIAAEAGDLEARLLFAGLLARRQDYRPAMEQLIEVVRRDRGYAEDAGRKTLLQLFNLLGPDSDLVREFRRELAQALNR